MTIDWMGWFVWPAAAACVIAFALHRLRGSAARATELASRPRELAGARLLYMEKQFRVRQPVSLVARIDRAYRAADGTIVLVELKTRWRNRPYATDMVQLSAQRMALEGQTGQPVAEHAFVTVQRPTEEASERRSHRVQLMEPAKVVALYRRRQDIIAGRVEPRYADPSRACKGCASRARCDRPKK